MLIKLTKISKELSDSGEKKLKEFEERAFPTNSSDSDNSLKDTYGRTAEDYREMGIPVPEELQELLDDSIENSLLDEHGDLDLDENKDYTEHETKFMCNTDKIIYIQEYDNDTTMMFLDSKFIALTGIEQGVLPVVVKESIDEIDSIINNSKNKN